MGTYILHVYIPSCIYILYLVSDLHVKFVLPPLPEPVLRRNYHVEVMENVGVLKLYLHACRLVILQLLNLKFRRCTCSSLEILKTSFTSSLSLTETRLSSFFVLVGFPSDSCRSLFVNVIMLRLYYVF